MIENRIKLKGGTISIRFHDDIDFIHMSDEEWVFVNALIEMLRDYEADEGREKLATIASISSTVK